MVFAAWRPTAENTTASTQQIPATRIVQERNSETSESTKPRNSKPILFGLHHIYGSRAVKMNTRYLLRVLCLPIRLPRVLS